MPVPEAPALQAEIDFQIRIVPADGTRAAKWRKRRLRYVPVFEQLSVKAICLPVSMYLGCRDQSTMARREINQRWRWSLLAWWFCCRDAGSLVASPAISLTRSTMRRRSLAPLIHIKARISTIPPYGPPISRAPKITRASSSSLSTRSRAVSLKGNGIPSAADLSSTARPTHHRKNVLIVFSALLAAIGAPRCSIPETTSMTSRLLIS